MSFIPTVGALDIFYLVWNSHGIASYMYIGLAVRTALAMGINREPDPDTSKPASMVKAETRLWW